MLGYLLYGPSLSGNQDYSSPVYNHKNVLIKYWPGFQGLRHIVFFGDSYTSTRFLPQNAQPSRENPFGNPPFPGNVSHKRPLWSDYLVGTYNESFLTAVNLAWGGATVNDELIVPFIDVIEGLNRQVKNNYLGKYAPMRNSSEVFSWQSHDTLFVFWFGINDVNGAWLWENRTDVWRRDLETYKENVVCLSTTYSKPFEEQEEEVDLLTPSGTAGKSLPNRSPQLPLLQRPAHRAGAHHPGPERRTASSQKGRGGELEQ